MTLLLEMKKDGDLKKKNCNYRVTRVGGRQFVAGHGESGGAAAERRRRGRGRRWRRGVGGAARRRRRRRHAVPAHAAAGAEVVVHVEHVGQQTPAWATLHVCIEEKTITKRGYRLKTLANYLPSLCVHY